MLEPQKTISLLQDFIAFQNRSIEKAQSDLKKLMTCYTESDVLQSFGKDCASLRLPLVHAKECLRNLEWIVNQYGLVIEKY